MNPELEAVAIKPETEQRSATSENRLGSDEKMLLAGLALLVIIIGAWLLSL